MVSAKNSCFYKYNDYLKSSGPAVKSIKNLRNLLIFSAAEVLISVYSITLSALRIRRPDVRRDLSHIRLYDIPLC